MKKSKGIHFLTLIIAIAFIVVACTPKEEEQVADILTNDAKTQEEVGERLDEDEMMDDSGDSMKVPAPGIDTDSVDEMIVEGEEDKEDAPEAQAHVFNVGGVNFAFDVKQIRVKKGDTVTINFISNSGTHDWVVDEFAARTQRVNAGSSSSVTFVADRAGTFEYYCSVGNHRALGMVGRLIVE